jgi:hypothetical protein
VFVPVVVAVFSTTDTLNAFTPSSNAVKSSTSTPSVVASPATKFTITSLPLSDFSYTTISLLAPVVASASVPSTITAGTADLMDLSALSGELVITNVTNDTTDVTVKGATGTNTVEFDTTTGDATFIGQDGVNTITAEALAGTTALEGNVNITTGSAADDINLKSTVGGYANWTVVSGAGDDAIDLITSTTNNTLNIDAGDGNDTLTADSITTSTVEVAMGAGNDTVSVDAITTGSVEGTMGDGNDTLSADAITTGSAEVDFGAGNDTATLTALTTGSAVLTMGEGNDTITVGGAATLTTNAAIVADLGNGDDTITIGENAALDANVNLVITGGTTGNDKVILSTTDASNANLVFTDVDEIAITDSVNTTFSVAQLSGKTYSISSNGGDTAEFTIDNSSATAATTIDLSALTINNITGTTLAATNLTLSNNGDTLKGTNAVATADYITGGTGNDTISTYNGIDAVIGKAGADTIDLTESTTTTADAVVYEAKTDGSAAGAAEGTFSGYDVITGFATTVDAIVFDTAYTFDSTAHDTVTTAWTSIGAEVLASTDGSTDAIDLSISEITDVDSVVTFLNDAATFAGSAAKDYIVAITFDNTTAIYDVSDTGDDAAAATEVTLLATVDDVLVVGDLVIA